MEAKITDRERGIWTAAIYAFWTAAQPEVLEGGATTFASKHGISNNFAKTLIEMKLVERPVQGHYLWTGDPPSPVMITQILHRQKEKNAISNAAAAERRAAEAEEEPTPIMEPAPSHISPKDMKEILSMFDRIKDIVAGAAQQGMDI